MSLTNQNGNMKDKFKSKIRHYIRRTIYCCFEESVTGRLPMSNSGKDYSHSGHNWKDHITCQPLHSMVCHPLGTSAQFITNVIQFLKWLVLRLDIAPSAICQVTILLFTLLYMHHRTGRHCSCYVASTHTVQALILGYSIIDHQDACVWFNKLDLFSRNTYSDGLNKCYNAIRRHLFISLTALGIQHAWEEQDKLSEL